MSKINNLLTIVTDHDIILDYCNLGTNHKGYFEYSNGQNFIFLHEDIYDDTAMHQSVLAEELGHYFTTIGNNTPYKYSSYSSKMRVEKYELYAHRWAADYLIPTVEVLAYARAKAFSSYKDLAELFQVTELLAKTKLEHMALIKPYWDLGNSSDMVLTNLPSIYLYTKIGNMFKGR